MPVIQALWGRKWEDQELAENLGYVAVQSQPWVQETLFKKIIK